LVTFSALKFKPDLRKENLGKWRTEYHHQVIKLIEKYPVDLIVLAGYMLIVNAEICRRYKMINLHPAKPGGPKGTWQEVIWQLIRNKEKESGVMMHLVTPELDAGPPISYCTYPIVGKEFDRLRRQLEAKLKTPPHPLPPPQVGKDKRKGKEIVKMFTPKTLERIIEEEGENEPLFKKIRAEGLKREFPLIISTIKNLANGKIKLNQKKPTRLTI